jgi:hypothetical protein
VARPTPEDFGLESNQIAWRAVTATQKGNDLSHDAWKDFAFGEPCLTRLNDEHLLLTLWSLQPDALGIVFIKLRMVE